MYDACPGTHAIFGFGSGFISKYALRLLSGELGVGYKNALLESLCVLPGTNGFIHCHCKDPFSLQCRSRRAVIRAMCSNHTLYKLLRVPYFFCCTRFVVFRFHKMLYIKLRSRYVDEAKALLSEMDIKYQHHSLRHSLMNLLEVECADYVMTIVTTLLHQKINLNPMDPGGYHFGTWEGWKEEAAEMFEGRFCKVRFIDIQGGTYQERYLVGMARSRYAILEPETTVRVMELPPPQRLDDGRWRCFFAPGYCQCTVRCDCPDSYAYADLNPYFVERYARDMTRAPHALKVYVQFYSALML